MIQIGDKIPATTLMEYSEVEGNGCSIGPNPVDTHKASAGKTIAILHCPARSPPPVRPSTCPVLWSMPRPSRRPVWTRSGASA